MIAAAPEGSLPRRISNKTIKKTLPAVPRRGPEAGFHRIHYDFHGLGVNPIDSCLFLQSKKNEKNKRNYSSFFSGRLKVSTSVISEMPLINSKPSWMILLLQRSQRRS